MPTSLPRIVALLLVLISWTNYLLAQGYTSEQERFTVNQYQGCAPLTVEVIDDNIDDSNTSPRIYKFNYDGNLSRVFIDENQVDKDTTYYIPGTYKILQVVGDELDSITIQVLEPRPPQYRVYNCINNSVYVQIDDDYYDQLLINYGDGSPPVAVSTDEPAAPPHQYNPAGKYTITVQGIFDNADSQNCAVSDTTLTTIDDLEIATINSVSVESNTAVRVSYQLIDPNVSYRLEVAEVGANDFTFAQYDVDDETQIRIEDPRLRTREQSYWFRIVAINRCDPTLDIPSERLPSIALQAEAGNLQNQLTWQAPVFTDYDVIRNEEIITRTTDTDYLDTDVECEQTYQYQVASESDVGTSFSEAIDVLARSVTVAPAPDSLQAEVENLRITVEWYFPPNVSELYIYRGADGAAPSLYDTKTLDGDTLATVVYFDPDTELRPGVEYCYQLSYQNECGVESALSEPVCVTVPAQGDVFFPNAFTPNDDGLNDIFTYTSRLIETVDFMIFNRWGELIFQSDQLEEGWDGSYGGQPAPQGTYLYKIEVTDELGKQFTRQGQFILLGR